MNQFGINHFIHDITFAKGQISILSNHAKIFEDYHKNQMPAVCTNEQGRILEPGIYLDCKLKREHSDYLWGIGKFSKKFNAKHFIHIIEKEVDCQHLYTFSFNIDEIDFLHFSINKIDTLKNFIARYKFQSQEIIRQAKLPKNRITLPLYDKNNHDDTLLSQENFLHQNRFNKSLLHKNTKESIALTPQQFKCLAFLMKGYSAQEIATHLNLSARTVEHYLARLRQKLGCSHSKELISTYYMDFYFDNSGIA